MSKPENVAKKNGTETRRPGNVGLRDVALRAGVSIATVSRVVNGISTVNPRLAKRIANAIEETGYLPNTHARSLVSGRSHLLGLIVSEITNPFFPELINEFESQAVAQGYEVLVASTGLDPNRSESLMRRMLQRSVDGIAVMTFGAEEKLAQILAERAFPLVFADSGPDLPNVRILKIDYEAGIRQAVQHLAALGHRRIAFVSGPLNLRSAVGRRDSFVRSMSELGLKAPTEHVVEGNHTMEGGIAAMEILLGLAELPTAVMCSNDMTAIGVLHALHATRQIVPGDISVVGFDDVHLARFMLPPLTTVRMSCGELAAAAIEALRAGIEDGHAKAGQKEWRIPTTMVIRQSTAFPRGSLPAQLARAQSGIGIAERLL